MSDDDDATARPRGVYWLPNMLTTGALFAGFYAIVAAIDLKFELAGAAVFIAMFFDGLDGRVARWTHTESAFGKEYDSLADMVAFGRLFISNPDLVSRLRLDAPLDVLDGATLYGGGAAGYTDYPELEQAMI